MKNLKKLSALVLSTLFVTMQISVADPINTGLGTQNGGAIINNTTGGFVGVDLGTGTATLNFDGDTHVNWNTLNVDKGETLNFNGTGSGLTVLNTVNQGMSNIYGQINANSAIGKLIISNPNGVLFDGAKFTTAGDLLITTQAINGLSDIDNASFTKMYDSTNNLIPVKILNNSDFQVGGTYTIIAPRIHAEASNIKADTLKLVTANGQDYLALGVAQPAGNRAVTTLKAMYVDGNLEIASDVGAVQITNGGTINGDFTANTGKSNMVWFNKESGGNRLTVNGDVNINSNGEHLILRNVDVDGDVNMKNVGGYVDLGDADITGNATLKTEGVETGNKYHHFVHVIGETNIDGNLDIDSSQNVHIGGYVLDASDPSARGVLADGKLTVGGDLTAHSQVGHITTTIDTTAKNIKYTADKLNILTDGEATLKADTYEFNSNGFIGGITANGGRTADDRISSIMETYTFIPADIDGHGYVNVDGGNIVAVNTPKLSPGGNDVQVYIKSKDDVKVTGANTGVLNITAPNKRIDIEGPDVHAKTINVGDETNYLKVEFDGRDYTTRYTSIKNGVPVEIAGDQKITYELADGGYNQPTLEPGAHTTYLIGPDPTPVPPPPPTPEPVNPPSDEPGRQIAQWVPEDVTKAPVNTPVAFAADLDDDEEGSPIRKNVDGSVTVVRAMPMM